MASSTLWLGKPDESESFWQQALGLTEAGDDLGFRVLMLGNLGLLALHRCDYARALEIYEEALVHLRELGVVDAANDTLMNLAWAHLGLGQLERGRECLRESGGRAIQNGSEDAAYHLLGVARLASLTSQHVAALRLTNAAIGLIASAEQVFEPYELSVVDAIRADAQAAKAATDAEATAPVDLSLSQSLALAAEILAEPPVNPG